MLRAKPGCGGEPSLAKRLSASRDFPKDRQVKDSDRLACTTDGAGTDEIRQASRDMDAYRSQRRGELSFGKSIPRKPHLFARFPAAGRRQIAEMFRQASRHGLQRKIFRERYEMRHVCTGHGDDLECDGGMLVREMLDRVHIDELQPRLGPRP